MLRVWPAYIFHLTALWEMFPIKEQILVHMNDLTQNTLIGPGLYDFTVIFWTSRMRTTNANIGNTFLGISRINKLI